jgi:hypothetical protein
MRRDITLPRKNSMSRILAFLSAVLLVYWFIHFDPEAYLAQKQAGQAESIPRAPEAAMEPTDGNARHTSPHLHFEVHITRGKSIDPALIFTQP